MNHSQNSINLDDAKQRCSERMKKLKNTQFSSQQGAAASQPRPLLHKELVGEKKVMNSEFNEAVEKGDMDNFVNVLEQVCRERNLPLSAVFDQVTWTGDSLLHVAADKGKQDIVELIADHFQELLIRRNARGDTALHVAVRCMNSNIVKFILNKDKKLAKEKNQYGNTPLHEAVYSEHVDVVNQILLADKDVVHSLNKSNQSPLYLAVANGNLEILNLLLDVPLPSDLPRCLGNSPLHAAILERKPDLIKHILVERPELVYLRDEDGGHLPIHLAGKRGHVEVVQNFLQRDWNINPFVLLNQKGQNILHVAAKNGRSDVVRCLMKNWKIDQSTINQKDCDGNTPLHLASKNLFPKVLYFITQDRRTNMNLLNNNGLTARDIVNNNQLAIRKFLANRVLKEAGVPLKVKDMLRSQHKQSPRTELSLKDLLTTFLVVATLMVTVTFAAAFTMPGGVYGPDDPNPKNRGTAIFAHKPLFWVFTIFNIIAMYSSVIACGLMLLAFVFDHKLATQATTIAMGGLVLAFLTVPVAFMAAVRLVVANNFTLALIITVIGVLYSSIILLCLVFGFFPIGYSPPQVAKLVLRILITLINYDDKPRDSVSQKEDKMRKDN
ncbi:Protein ACCELERATED CELL DEATH 6 [Glycine soja]|uniref:Protein ACCELERATED CELL DEATH 6 n=1 Tax=Glycine soja TaxID=3848 RepID=A0A445HNS0_GLYSO|nr:Protein ACCELERATED CELL DEATH 6 [Glycine soja]